MTVFNDECWGVWDGSFEIDGDKITWKADIHPAIIFFNFLLPTDHMTDNILPLLEARLLLGGIPFQVAAGLNEEYQDARVYLAPMYAADMAYLIIFLTHKRPDLKPFEVLWCAAHAAVKINLPACEKYKKIPMMIRGRVKRDAIPAFRSILHNPNFKFVGSLLGHALRALEVYIRPLVTDISPFVWIDAQFLRDLHDIHELSLDGAKARKTLFDYLQQRHPGVETLWHSLVQIYNTYDSTHFPEHSSQPMSKPSLILWELFFRQARQDVPFEYPQALPSVLRRTNSSPTLRDLSDEGEQKKPKKKKKRKKRPKGGKVVKLVEEPAVPKQSASDAQPASQQQPSAGTVEILPPPPTMQEPSGKSEQKQLKKNNKKKKPKKLEPAERTESPAVEECPPPVTGNDDESGDNVISNNDDDGDSVIDNNNDGNNVCLTPAEDPADEGSVNEDPAQEDPSDEELAMRNCKATVANTYEVLQAKPLMSAGILAEKRTLHGHSGDDPEAVEDNAKSSDSWRKVQVRMKPQQKQKKRRNDRDTSKDISKATGSVSTGAKSLPAKAKAPVPSAKSLREDAKSRPTKMKAEVLREIASRPTRDDDNIARDHPTSWAALFNRFGDKRRRGSLQDSNPPTNTADAQLLATTGTEGHKSIQEAFPPLDRSPLVQSETPMDEEMSKSSAAYGTTALLPPEDDVPVDSPAMQDTAMSHVEQWLASKYAAAFVGLTQAEIENAHWRPEQPTAIEVHAPYREYQKWERGRKQRVVKLLV